MQHENMKHKVKGCWGEHWNMFTRSTTILPTEAGQAWYCSAKCGKIPVYAEVKGDNEFVPSSS